MTRSPLQDVLDLPNPAGHVGHGLFRERNRHEVVEMALIVAAVTQMLRVATNVIASRKVDFLQEALSRVRDCRWRATGHGRSKGIVSAEARNWRPKRPPTPIQFSGASSRKSTRSVELQKLRQKSLGVIRGLPLSPDTAS